jgi:hypothetical protein
MSMLVLLVESAAAVVVAERLHSRGFCGTADRPVLAEL